MEKCMLLASNSGTNQQAIPQFGGVVDTCSSSLQWAEWAHNMSASLKCDPIELDWNRVTSPRIYRIIDAECLAWQCGDCHGRGAWWGALPRRGCTFQIRVEGSPQYWWERVTSVCRTTCHGLGEFPFESNRFRFESNRLPDGPSIRHSLIKPLVSGWGRGSGDRKNHCMTLKRLGWAALCLWYIEVITLLNTCLMDARLCPQLTSLGGVSVRGRRARALHRSLRLLRLKSSQTIKGRPSVGKPRTFITVRLSWQYRETVGIEELLSADSEYITVGNPPSGPARYRKM